VGKFEKKNQNGRIKTHFNFFFGPGAQFGAATDCRPAQLEPSSAGGIAVLAVTDLGLRAFGRPPRPVHHLGQRVAKDRWPFNQIKRLELNIFKFPADVFDSNRIGG
jgi:hypothetical protein